MTSSDSTPNSPPPPPPLADSPWFWLYLFATFGLVALFWMGPKYADRQSQLDRQFQGREFHARQQTTPADERSERLEEYSVPEQKLRDLRWLGYPLALILAGAWFRLLWQRRQARRVSPSLGDESHEAPVR